MQAEPQDCWRESSSSLERRAGVPPYLKVPESAQSKHIQQAQSKQARAQASRESRTPRCGCSAWVQRWKNILMAALHRRLLQGALHSNL